MFTIRVTAAARELIMRAVRRNPGCSVSQAVRCAARRHLAGTLPDIPEAEIEKYINSVLDEMIPVKNPGCAGDVPKDELRIALVRVALGELAKPLPYRPRISEVEGVDWIREGEDHG